MIPPRPLSIILVTLVAVLLVTPAVSTATARPPPAIDNETLVADNEPIGIGNETITIDNGSLTIANETLAADNEPIGIGNETITIDNGSLTIANETLATTSETNEPPNVGSDTLNRTHYVELTPDDPGAVRVHIQFAVPANITTLKTNVPESATVRRTRGFRQGTERTYEWTRTTQHPSITYRWSVNQTVRSGHRAGDYLFVDTGSWAILRAPRTGVGYTATGGRPALVDSLEINGSGATGGDIVYLGDYEEHTSEAAGQRLRLVVPAAADGPPSPEAVLASIGTIAKRDLGPRDQEVFVVAAPPTGAWGAGGLQLGSTDAWVRNDQGLDSANNVWLHEYVHTRQVYRATPETRWMGEGMAQYYAALGALDQRRIEYDAFQRHLRKGTSTKYDDVVLDDPDTWSEALAKYRKGALVMAAIDRQIRLATDGQRTLADVLVRVNRKEKLSQTDFLDAVEAVAGPEVRESARRYTETSATPATWNRSEHAKAFGLPTRSSALPAVGVIAPDERAEVEELRPVLSPPLP